MKKEPKSISYSQEEVEAIVRDYTLASIKDKGIHTAVATTKTLLKPINPHKVSMRFEINVVVD